MHRRFKISVDGRSYDVVVEELAHDAPAASAPMPVAAAVPAAAVRAEPAPAPQPAPSAAAGGPGVQTAPLAGVVESIAVTVGATVAVGDVVATIEAMKMKTEVVSHAAGTVTAIPAKVGEPVDAGTPLVVIG